MRGIDINDMMTFKNILAKIFLLSLNSLLRLKRLLVFLLKSFLIKPTKKSGLFLIKIFFLPFYKIYYLGKIRLNRPDRLPLPNFSGLLAKPLIIPILLFSIAFLVVIDNIEARGKIMQLNGGSVLSALVDPEQAEDIVEEVIAQAPPQNPSVNYFSSQAYLEPSPVGSEEVVWTEAGQEITSPGLANGYQVKPHILTFQANEQKRTETEYYTVQPGDTVSSIAVRFGVSVNTILWENNLRSYTLIRPGDKLAILPTSGVSHKVAKNETLNGLANKYKVTPEEILKANQLALDAKLQIGQSLIIPGGAKISYAQPRSNIVTRLKDIVAPPSAALTNANLQWPTTDTRLTQYYSWRHSGLDIAGTLRSPIYAAESGVVESVGWGSGYGYQILIKHDNGLKTRYAHLSKFFVEKGQRVARGETIGLVGSTGRSTGPHLHFEVYDGGVRRNPLSYLR